MKLALSTLALLFSAASATSLRGVGASDNGLQVVIPGALREMSPADAKVFKDALSATYQDAYAADDVHFVMEAKNGLGWQCRRCRQDDDAAATEDEDSLRVSVEWQCRRCRQDDDSAASKVGLGSGSPAVHSAWEKAFCAKIAGAGVANFANARDCRIRVAATGASKEQQ